MKLKTPETVESSWSATLTTGMVLNLFVRLRSGDLVGGQISICLTRSFAVSTSWWLSSPSLCLHKYAHFGNRRLKNLFKLLKYAIHLR